MIATWPQCFKRAQILPKTFIQYQYQTINFTLILIFISTVCKITFCTAFVHFSRFQYQHRMLCFDFLSPFLRKFEALFAKICQEMEKWFFCKHKTEISSCLGSVTAPGRADLDSQVGKSSERRKKNRLNIGLTKYCKTFTFDYFYNTFCDTLCGFSFDFLQLDDKYRKHHPFKNA